MRKYFFNWTAQEMTQWQAIRKRGLFHFVLWYGILMFSGVLFLLIGGFTVLTWVKDMPISQAAVTNTTGPQLAFLGLELLFIALVCLVAGILCSLLTWVMEEAVYRKITRGKT